MSFNSISRKIQKNIILRKRIRATDFERLMKAYLLTDPKYAYNFKKVWLWNEFPAENDLGGGDTGIDLVALTNDGDYWAIQCKCYQEGTLIDTKVQLILSSSTSGRTVQERRP
jgi:predicted helicase